MKKFGALNIFLVFFVGVILILLSFLTPIVNIFQNVETTSNFLLKAKVYENLAILAKQEIRKNYPPDFASKQLQVALADKALDAVVTPELTKNLVETGLKVSVKVAQTPTSIIDDKVVIDTDPYKAQVSELVKNLDLGPQLDKVVQNVVKSVPQKLVLVDTESRPNSVLAMIIKLRTVLQYSRTINTVVWILLLVSFLGLVINNFRRIKSGLLALAFAFGGAAFSVLATTFLVDTVTQSGLVGDALSYVASQVGKIGIAHAIIALVLVLVWKFVSFDKLQKKINKKLK